MRLWSSYPAGESWRTLVVALLLVGACSAQTSQISDKSAKSSTASVSDAAASGVIRDGEYRSSFFGFGYKIPFGWVDRTQAMGEGTDPAPQADDASLQRGKGQVLLAVFERPPEAKGETVNSAVIVAMEPVAEYPGLKNAEQYFVPLTELTKSKGLTVVNQPYEFRVGARSLMRGDFSKDMGPLKMHQSTLVMMDKGCVVSFTFIGGSEDEVDELVERLSFISSHAMPPQKRP